MNNGMTIKQIAELCGVSERTVRDWAWKAAAKTAAESAAEIAPEETPIGKKLTEAGHGKPAWLLLNEVLASVRAGGKNTLADLLEANAKGAVPPDNRIDRLELLIERLITGIPAIITQTVQAVARISPPANIQGKLALPPASNGSYFTIKGYAARLGNSVRVADAVRLGREASKLSREKNYAIHQVEDEAWGRVNSYHIDVLKEVFTI